MKLKRVEIQGQIIGKYPHYLKFLFINLIFH